MTGVQPSAKDSGIVETVLGFFIGLVVLGAGIYGALNWSETMVVLGLLGIGLFVTVGAANDLRKTIQHLKEAGVTDPVEVLREDMNDRDEIIRDLLKLVLFWVAAGVLWAFAIATPAEASRVLETVATTRPELVAGWVLFNVIMVLAIVFRSYRTKGSPTGPI